MWLHGSQWADVTPALDVIVKRGSDSGLSRQIEIKRKTTGTRLAPGYYAVVAVTDSGSGNRLYCDATNATTPPSVATNLTGLVQYNFRLFRDCNNDGTEDTGTNPCQNATCPADMDNGSMTGLPDGGVTVDDLVYFLELYALGYVEADVDDGSSTGAQDQGVTIDDLLYFMTRFEAGC